MKKNKCMWFTHIYICVNYIESESVSHLIVSDSLWPQGTAVHQALLHGILQARILEWVAISFYRGSSWPRDWICVSCIAD